MLDAPRDVTMAGIHMVELHYLCNMLYCSRTATSTAVLPAGRYNNTSSEIVRSDVTCADVQQAALYQVTFIADMWLRVFYACART